MRLRAKLKDIKTQAAWFFGLAVHQNRVAAMRRLSFPCAGLMSVIWVDPKKIKFKILNGKKLSSRHNLFQPGTWSNDRICLKTHEAEDVRLMTCAELLLQDRAINQTTEFVQMCAKLQMGEQPRGLKSESDIELYISKQFEMYKQVQKDGRLKTQYELGESRFSGEINCVVGQDGELLKATDGNHRFAVARLLGLKSIPVQVSRIHADLLPHVQSLSARSATEAVNNYL